MLQIKTKDLKNKGSRTDFIVRKASQQINELSFSEYNKASAINNESSSDNKEYDNEKEDLKNIVKLKSKNKWKITLSKMSKYCMWFKNCLETIIIITFSLFLPENEEINCKNLAIVVLNKKKYYGLSIEDVIPQKYIYKKIFLFLLNRHN